MLRTTLTLFALASMVSAQTLRITEVLFEPDSVSFDQVTEITNVGDVPIDLSGAFLCLQGACIQLPSQWLKPASAVRVHNILDGANTPADIFLPAFGTMDPAAGGVTLVATTNGPPPQPGSTDPGDMIDFVQFGAAGQLFSNTAVAAGVWTDVADVASAPGFGASLAWGGSGIGPSAWFGDVSPTLGSANLSPTAAVRMLFPSCTAFALGPTLVAPSAPALGNKDFSVVLQSQLPGKPGLLLVGIGTTSLPVLQECTLHVDEIFLQLPMVTDGTGSFVMSAIVPDSASLLGTEIGMQALIANDVSMPQFDLSNGLSITF